MASRSCGIVLALIALGFTQLSLAFDDKDFITIYSNIYHHQAPTGLDRTKKEFANIDPALAELDALEKAFVNLDPAKEGDVKKSFTTGKKLRHIAQFFSDYGVLHIDIPYVVDILQNDATRNDMIAHIKKFRQSRQILINALTGGFDKLSEQEAKELVDSEYITQKNRLYFEAQFARIQHVLSAPVDLDYLDKWTKWQLLAVAFYISSGGYTPVNSFLREKQTEPKMAKFVEITIEAIRLLPTFSGTITRTLEHLPDEDLRKALQEKKYQDLGFMSATTIEHGFNLNPKFTFIITTKNGRDLRLMNPSEREVLILPSTVFAVTRHVEANGKHTFYLSDSAS